MIKFLISSGARMNAIDRDGEYDLPFLRVSNVVLMLYSTPLHVATACNRDFRIIQELIAEGSELDSVNFAGRTPLHKHCDAVTRQILQCCTEPLDLYARDSEGMTVLHYLSWSKMTTADEIRLLSKNDPLPLTLKDNLGRSALHFAVMRGNTPLILYLLELGIYPCQSLVTLQGATLLHLAVTSRRVETLDLVAPYSESIFVKDDKGRSILHYAVWHFNGMAVEKIITQGGWDLVRQSDCDGETPKELARRIKARSILTYIEELDGIGDSTLIPPLVIEDQSISVRKAELQSRTNFRYQVTAIFSYCTQIRIVQIFCTIFGVIVVLIYYQL